MDWSEFVGLQWRDRGRDLAGVDCWGLTRLAFRAGTGIDLPSHADAYQSAADRSETVAVFAGEVSDWSPIDEIDARAFDVAVFVSARRLHVGLVVRSGRVLHIEAGRSSVIAPIGQITGVLEGVYRHVLLCPNPLAKTPTGQGTRPD